MEQPVALVIGFVWPEPKSSAAGSRMLQLMGQLQHQGYKVEFVTAAKHSEKAFDLEPIGVQSQNIRLNDSSFDDFVKTLQPQLVLFDRFMVEEQFGWRIAEQCPEALRILDTEDFHALRKAREVALKENRSLTTSDLQSETAKREIASIFRCDVSLMISEYEMELLQTQFNIPKSILYYLPFLLDPISEKQIKSLPKFEERQHFITIGNFLHPPNYDAVLYLKTSIWPQIRQRLPKAELHVYGAYESQKVTQLHNEQEGFMIMGFAEDVNDVMRYARVCLAPLRFGAGLKGKLIDAMQNATPCVMSSIAAEGMFGDLPPNGCIEDDSASFVEKAVMLYSKKELWTEKRDNGIKVVNERFKRSDFEKDFKLRIENIRNNLKTHRQQNFFGQVLQHQTLQSTKYMSRWIEEKNK